MEIVKSIKTAAILVTLLTLLTGVVYPYIVTLFAQGFFPWQANGSLLVRYQQIVGSALIGQSFTGTDYFWGRPSATRPMPYNALQSGGSNLAPQQSRFQALVLERVQYLKQAHPDSSASIPADLVTASGSGLDPEVSVAAAYYQAPRIARQHRLSLEQVQTLIREQAQGRWGQILGTQRINVLKLNLALMAMEQRHE